ncbi:MAG: threonylcarbamoyl-AMP synthase [Candidatus Eremiobacteraeota bacterium]|nr:threonylcarbamoyl-AMP synthase [Candidatus Eremiobacteraeota bacterium]
MILKVSAEAGGHPFRVPIVAAGPQSIAQAAGLLRAGELVAFPTETVYGLGALAFNVEAVAKIFEVKRRPAFDPLIVHILDRSMLEEVTLGLTPLGEKLAAEFWPGPLTLVLPKAANVSALVTAGLPTVAVRMPAQPVARALLTAVGAPIAAPSANPFGGLSPTRAGHVAEGLGDRVGLILDGGPTEHGIESTVVALEPEPELLRPGAVALEEIERIAGPLLRGGRGSVRAPGQLELHYAPRTPLRIVDPATVPKAQRQAAGVVTLREEFGGYAASRVLSSNGNLREAAGRFFDILHELDSLGLERIDAQALPEHGLGMAMMDRLRRAAASRNASGSPSVMPLNTEEGKL